MAGWPASLVGSRVCPGPEPSAARVALCWWCQPKVTSKSWRLLLKAPEYLSEVSYDSLMYWVASALIAPLIWPGLAGSAPRGCPVWSSPKEPLPPDRVGVP